MKKKKRVTKKYDSNLEAAFARRWRRDTEIPIRTQVMFHPRRKWRFDFAFPEIYLAIEIQGYGRGHVSYTGMAKDHEKFNSATRFGWSVIFLMSKDVKPDTIDKTVRRIARLYHRRKALQEHYQLLGNKLKEMK